jgi:phosphomannomutase
LHYGRDALVGVALFLSLLAEKGCTMSALKATYPQYHISKNKIQLTPDIDVDRVLAIMLNRYTDYNVTDIDGVKIDFPTEWVHLRKSNTEPIIRIYSESRDEESAERLAKGIMNEIEEIVGAK